MRRASVSVVAMVAALLLAACGGSGGTSSSITVNEAWVNSAPLMGMPGAAYFVIQNNGAAADQLLSVESDIAQTLEMHETKESGGIMQMSPVASVPIPAGSQVEFKPGGFHVMLIGLTRELKTGDKVQLMLNFEKAGKVPVTAEVREQ